MKYLLICQNEVIQSFNEQEKAQEMALNLAQESGKDITISEVKGFAKHKIVIEEFQPVEETPAPASSRKRIKQNNVAVVQKDNIAVEQGVELDNILIEEPTQNTPEILESCSAEQNILEVDTAGEEKEPSQVQTITEKVIEASKNHEEGQKQAFKEFVLVFNKALSATNSVADHVNACSEYKDKIETFNKNQKEMISSLKKENIKRVAIKDLSIELSNPSVKKLDDLDKILNRYPENVKEDSNIQNLISSLLSEFKSSSTAPAPDPDTAQQEFISDEVFHKHLKNYEKKLSSANSFMDYDAVIEEFKALNLELSKEQQATFHIVEKLNYDRIDKPVQEIMKNKKSSVAQELKAIDEELPPSFDEKEFKEKCKEAFSHAHTQNRLEEYRDHLLEENKEFDKITKPIIYTAFYERLANLQKAKPKYSTAVV